MEMKVRGWIIILAMSIGISAQSQEYQWGLGVRLGPWAGITAKYSVGNVNYIDGILHFRWNGASITGLYEVHAEAFKVPDLYWYYGGGAHLGYWSETHGHPYYHDFETHTLLGVDGIIGLEYYIRDIPFTIGLDYKPSLNFFDYFGPFFDEFGVTIRYVF